MLRHLERLLSAIVTEDIVPLEDAERIETEDPETIVIRGELFETLWNCINEMKTADKELILSLYRDGKTFVEIAQETGQTVRALQRRAGRALGKLQNNITLVEYLS